MEALRLAIDSSRNYEPTVESIDMELRITIWLSNESQLFAENVAYFKFKVSEVFFELLHVGVLLL